MSERSEFEAMLRVLPLDGSLLVLDPETESFYKAETGIQDIEELRKHIIGLQEEAFKVNHCPSANLALLQVGNIVFCIQVFPYPCIYGFKFAKVKVAKIPAYPSIFELLKNRPGAIFLDIGCCGTNLFLSRSSP